MLDGLTRRDLLRAGAAAGALAGLDALAPAQVLERVLAAPAACGQLKDIEHVVIFINENRAFDHYFGGYKGVRGFGDPNAPRLHDGSGKSVFAQPFPPLAAGEDSNITLARQKYGGHLLPFHFDTNQLQPSSSGSVLVNGECVNDISHEWYEQHEAWNGGAMDKFLSVHLDKSVNRFRDGVNTMGYYQRSDLPFYYALADAFALCDAYFCSVIGPTDPNRMYSMTGTIDPDGKHGGPLLHTLVSNRAQNYGKFSWPTYPEQLQAKGISWKVYGTADGHYGDNVLPYFAAYQSNPQLAANGLSPTFPANFQADCAAGTLPQVSWVLASLVDSEHPPAPVTGGEAAAAQMLEAVTANSSLWAKTAVFMTYDENGGFFDHVPPPVAPPGTPGEWVTVRSSTTSPDISRTGKPDILGPIGLGFRVPMLVVSPFSRGGFVCSDTFDHTSLLRFLETRFGAEVPNLTDWRRSVTGDLTSAFNFASPNPSLPTLPGSAQLRSDPRVLASDCPTQGPDAGSESFPSVQGYPLPPPPQAMPTQMPGSPRRPSGLVVMRNGRCEAISAANPLGLPSATTCKNPNRFAFLLRQPHHGRIVRVDVYVNGRRRRPLHAHRGRTVRSVVLTGLPAGDFTLKVVATVKRDHHHHRIVTTRTYRSCATKISGPHRRRHHRHRQHTRA
jgi:phospholipase C